jgi:hypothetical protein
LYGCMYRPTKLLLQSNKFFFLGNSPKNTLKSTGLSCKQLSRLDSDFFHVPSFSICSHQVPIGFPLCSQFVPPCSCYVPQHILNSTSFFYPICFGKCCLALTGPPLSVLPHIKHMQIFFSFFFFGDTQCVSVNFFFNNFFHFVNRKNGKFLDILCFPSVYNSTSSASFFGKSKFQYHKIDKKK